MFQGNVNTWGQGRPDWDTNNDWGQGRPDWDNNINWGQGRPDWDDNGWGQWPRPRPRRPFYPPFVGFPGQGYYRPPYRPFNPYQICRRQCSPFIGNDFLYYSCINNCINRYDRRYY